MKRWIWGRGTSRKVEWMKGRIIDEGGLQYVITSLEGRESSCVCWVSKGVLTRENRNRSQLG